MSTTRIKLIHQHKGKKLKFFEKYIKYIKDCDKKKGWYQF